MKKQRKERGRERERNMMHTERKEKREKVKCDMKKTKGNKGKGEEGESHHEIRMRIHSFLPPAQLPPSILNPLFHAYTCSSLTMEKGALMDGTKDRFDLRSRSKPEGNERNGQYTTHSVTRTSLLSFSSDILQKSHRRGCLVPGLHRKGRSPILHSQHSRDESIQPDGQRKGRSKQRRARRQSHAHAQQKVEIDSFHAVCVPASSIASPPLHSLFSTWILPRHHPLTCWGRIFLWICLIPTSRVRTSRHGKPNLSK